MSARVSPAFGFDVVLEIDPASYEIVRDADDIARAFEMDDTTRQQVADAIRSAVDHPEAVTSLEIEPGYVRVCLTPSREGPPPTVVDDLRRAASIYSDRHAVDRDVDGFRFGDSYIGTYQSDDAVELEEFVDLHTGADVAPDCEGPCFEFEREADVADNSSRQLAYVFAVPFDTDAMYQSGASTYWNPEPVFEWDDKIQEELQTVVESKPIWPGGRDVARVALYPEHAEVSVYTEAVNNHPTNMARRACTALLSYNRYRKNREYLGDDDGQLHPPLELSEPVYIGADDVADAEGWIADRGLDEVDGEPTEPEPDQEAGDDVSQPGSDGQWSRINPFGGSP